MLGEFGQGLKGKERRISHLIAAALWFTRERGADKKMWSKAVFTFFAFANRDQFNRGDAKFFLRFAPRSVFRSLPFHAIAARAAKQAAPSIGRPRLSGADAGRASGGGALLAGLAFTPVAPTADICPGVTAFTVPQSERDPRWICTKNLFEKTEDGRIAPDSFEDDLSLLVRTEKGASVLLGCAHAGLPNILGYAARHFGIDRFEAVIGGTHLSSVAREDYPAWMAELAQYNVRRWRPCHCTGFAAAAELARRFNDVDWASAGTVHEL